MTANDAAGGAGGAMGPDVGYDPGWNAQTWSGAEPEPTPAPTTAQSLGGAARMATFVVATLALLPLFFAARAVGGGRDRRVAAWWCGCGARLLGLTFNVRGAPMRSGGALLVNHASYIDILVMGWVAPVHFVSKAEVSGWPMFGWIGKISNTVFIERRRAEAKAQERILAERAREGHLLCLFPEGTSTDGQRVLPFKSALLRAFMADPEDGAPAAPVQPVSVHYRPAAHLPRSFYGWWGRRGLFEHLRLVAALSRGGVATVIFHEPLDPATFADRKALAAAAHAVVAAGRDAAAEEAVAAL